MKETKPTISDLLALCDEAIRDDERATPGPWRFDPPEAPAGAVDVLVGVDVVVEDIDGIVAEFVAEVPGHMDATFIAHARTREPVLARALREVLAYDKEHGIECDSYATGYPTEAVVRVSPMLEVDGGEFYMSPREARSLAASLIRAAAEAEQAGGREP